MNLIHDELIEIKKSIHPQANEIYLFYTDIWDSVVSSGMVRLLTTDQVTKLSKVYKSIKGVSYETQWVRRDYEELQSTPNPADKRACIEEKCIEIRDSHYNRMIVLVKKVESFVIRVKKRLKFLVFLKKEIYFLL